MIPNHSHAPAAQGPHLPSPPATKARGRRSHSARRSQWRQRLIEAESGFRLGIRTDGTLFVHLFILSGILAAGFVLQLGLVQWALLVLAITLVLSAELFHQMLRVLWKGAERHLPSELRNVVRIGTAAVVLSSVGAVVVLALVFAQRISQMRGG
jgi:diacylglycerol kinase